MKRRTLARLLAVQVQALIISSAVAGPLVWFDGNDPFGTGLQPTAGTPIGTPTTKWVDKSGNFPALGAVAEPSLGVNLPVFNVGQLNSRGTVSFGGEHILESPFDIRGSFNGGVDYTTFTVFKTGANLPLNVVWADRPSDGPAHTVSIINNRATVRAGAQDARSLDSVTNNRGHLVTYGVDSGAGFFDLDGRRLTAAPGVGSAFVEPGTFVVGGGIYSDNTAATFFNGEVGEIVMFDRALSTQERADVNAYLGDKWGIGVPHTGDANAGLSVVAGVKQPVGATSITTDIAPGQRNLVVVTHGWAGNLANDDVTALWMDSMVRAIESQVDEDQWAVVKYDWTESSGKPFHSNTGPAKDFGPVVALSHSHVHGLLQGSVWGQAEYDNVHIIGYSAGSAFLDAAAKAIKAFSDDTHVHLTFLDAFIPPFINTATFASSADWSDNYFVRDDLPLLFDLPWTDISLDKAHNVDLTGLAGDPSHFTPVDFYRKSIDGVTFYDELGDNINGIGGVFDEIDANELTNALVRGTNLNYGFQLSLEEGPVFFSNLDETTKEALRVGNDPPEDFSFPAPVNRYYALSTSASSSQIASLASVTGETKFFDHGVDLEVGSPVWAILWFEVGTDADLVDMNIDFTSQSPADGLLVVYANDVLIGAFNERLFGSGGADTRLPLPNSIDGKYQVAFRLDSPGDLVPSVSIRNITFSTINVPEPNTCILLLVGASFAFPASNRALGSNRIRG